MKNVKTKQSTKQAPKRKNLKRAVTSALRFDIFKMVYETFDYGRFKHAKNNRAEKKGYIEKKVQFYIDKYNDGEFIPELQEIRVNKNFVIWEGNHRFEACKRLGLPIYFIIDEDDIVNGSASELSTFQRIYNGVNASWTRNQIFITALSNGKSFAVEVYKTMTSLIAKHEFFDKRTMMPSKIIGLVLGDVKYFHGSKLSESVLGSDEYTKIIRSSDIYKNDLAFFIALSELLYNTKTICENRLVIEVAFEFIWGERMTKKQVFHWLSKEGLGFATKKKEIRQRFEYFAGQKNPKKMIDWVK